MSFRKEYGGHKRLVYAVFVSTKFLTFKHFFSTQLSVELSVFCRKALEKHLGHKR